MADLDEKTRAYADSVEKKYEIPAGMLSAVLAEGGSLTPSARKQVLDVYGIDGTLSPQNEVEVAGIALQDALGRNQGNQGLALAEFKSGQSREAWGADTNQFVRRVRGRSASGVTMSEQAPRTGGRRSASGATVDTAADSEQQMPASAQASPSGPPPAGEAEAPGTADAPLVVGPKTLASYADGSMPLEKRQKFERLVQSGAYVVPQGFQLGVTQTPSTTERVVSAVRGAPAAIREAVTGENRRTAETEAAPDFYTGPEFSPQMAALSAQQGQGTPEERTTRAQRAMGAAETVQRNAVFADPAEIVQIVQANFPGTQARQDERGNWFVRSSIDGQERAIKPGLRWTDIPRVVGAAGLGAATVATGGVLPAVAAGAAGQAVVEAGQAASGGNFNAGEVGLAGLTAGIPAAGGAVLQRLAPGARNIANAALDAVPGSTTAARAVNAVDGATSTAVNAGDTTVVNAVDDATRSTVPRAQQTAPALSSVDQSVTQRLPTASQAIPSAAPAAAQDAAQAAPAASAINDAGDVDFAKLADLARKAAADGRGGETARRELAASLKVNPDAAAAAARLGIEVPADILGDSVQIRDAIGGLRAQIGGEAKAKFAEAMDGAVSRADNIIADLGGAQSADNVSQRVFDSLDGVRADLDGQAGRLYADVDAVIRPAEKVRLDNVSSVLSERLRDLGGDEALLQPIEQKLMRLASNPNATYEALREQKALIGKALRREESPYGSMDERILKRLYGAMSEDQGANVARLGGEEAKASFLLANQLTAKKKAVEEQLVKSFGREGNGSIAGLIEGAVRDAGKGNIKRLNQLLDVVPKDMQADALMTGIASLSRAKGGAAKGQFGFSEFADVFRGLRAKGNERIYAHVVDTLGPQRAATLRDLYEISRRITDARAAVPTTGRANQPLLQNLASENFVGRIVNSALGRRATGGAGAAVGGLVGGPLGAAAGADIASSMMAAVAKGGEKQVAAVGKLLSSPEFRDLAIELATKGNVPAAEVKRVARSAAFRAFADSIGVPRDLTSRERFLLDALTITGQTARQGASDGEN